MTMHLYYENSYLKEFEASVLEQHRRGDHHAVVLDKTAFYPTSGGQPHDTGELGKAHVIAVEEEPFGAIIHIVDSPVGLGPVKGRIDWDRRFDHMQQHTGQHILSQAFVQVAQAATLSFHLGQEICSIDIDLSNPDDGAMAAAETLASRIVFENRPVGVLLTTRDELGSLGVRKESQREGDIRVIDVEGFDRSPCGGTHVCRTGEIGLIAILGWERYKGGTRVEFACGGRALKTLRTDHDTLKVLGRIFSSHPHELPRLAEKSLGERAAALRENSRLQKEILGFEAGDLVRNASKRHNLIIVRKSYAGRGIDDLKFLAQKIVAYPSAVAILGSVHDTGVVVAARNPDSPGDCGSAVKEACAKLGGRGGGKPELAQAGGIAVASLENWLDTLESCLLNQQTGD